MAFITKLSTPKNKDIIQKLHLLRQKRRIAVLKLERAERAKKILEQEAEHIPVKSVPQELPPANNQDPKTIAERYYKLIKDIKETVHVHSAFQAFLPQTTASVREALNRLLEDVENKQKTLADELLQEIKQLKNDGRKQPHTALKEINQISSNSRSQSLFNKQSLAVKTNANERPKESSTIPTL